MLITWRSLILGEELLNDLNLGNRCETEFCLYKCLFDSVWMSLCWTCEPYGQCCRAQWLSVWLLHQGVKAASLSGKAASEVRRQPYSLRNCYGNSSQRLVPKLVYCYKLLRPKFNIIMSTVGTWCFYEFPSTFLKRAMRQVNIIRGSFKHDW